MSAKSPIAVYTAVPVDFELETSSDEWHTLTMTPRRTNRVPTFVGGSFLGIGTAFAGLYWLDNYYGLVEHSEESVYKVFLYSFVWSLLTAGTACGVFSCTTNLFTCFQSASEELNESDGDENSLLDRNDQIEATTTLSEYEFVLGVFVGFCATCTVHDAINGFPIINIVLTALAAFCWAALLVLCRSKQSKDTTLHSTKFRERRPISIIVV